VKLMRKLLVVDDEPKIRDMIAAALEQQDREIVLAESGEQALTPKRGEDWQKWLLWAVLAVGAALVLAVSLKVLRHPKAD